ncbi:MAG: prepilin-type N-terminal cleavage/methylation domain-containing protein [Helicobacteraceae bacterium]|nr:prepilin-type N-terminal cleavage/methylation domain-containing protein [Helicobacteraceae bacterium]
MKKAFTLIELIFAIVVISIAFMAIPSMNRVSSQNVESSLISEALVASVAKIDQILTFNWDENSSYEGAENTTSYSKVLDISSADSELERVAGSNYRVGHISSMLHRKFHSSEVNSTQTLGAESDFDDIDDFIVSNQNLFASDVVGADGYKQHYLIDIDVSYISDAATYSDQIINDFSFSDTTQVNPTNMKMITITTKKEQADGSYSDEIKLRAYSSNIGEIDYYKRRY